MATEVTIPSFGESITQVEIEEWLKQEGDWVELDEDLVVLASDKASLELPAPKAGVLSAILKEDGAEVKVGDVIARIEEGERPAGKKSASKEKKEAQEESAPSTEKAPTKAEEALAEAKKADDEEPAGPSGRQAPASPTVRRMLFEHGLDPGEVQGSGPDGRITQADVRRALDGGNGTGKQEQGQGPREEKPVRMSLLRRKIAERLLEASQSTAMLTTFNEVDMGPVMTLRKQYKEAFLDRYGIKLGFMSFFVKAAIEALKAHPAINAEIRGKELVYKNYYDVGVAIGSGKGLTVPVIRNAELLSFAEVEQTITDFARRAQSGDLKPDELTGGTFTISNGGVYGSLLSTPILNPPQSGILGMHKIEERVQAIDGKPVVRPMMYLALTYDHRVVDGREAVGCLVKIKECIEDPSRMLLEV